MPKLDPVTRQDEPVSQDAAPMPCCGRSPLCPDGYHLCTEPIGHDGECMDAHYVWLRWEQ